jgi:FKBP-type peptidyl-prolyl cis-trans isomerase FklB
MNSLIKILLASMIILPQFCFSGNDSNTFFKVNKKASMKTEHDKFSYILGIDLAENFTKQEIKINPELIFLGLKAALTDKKYRMTDAEMKEVLKSFQVKMTAKRQEQLEKMRAKLKADAAKNKKASDAYLAKHKKEKGVKSTKSGLQYKVLTNGKSKGKKPADGKFVVVEYTGKLIDGTVFDSTSKNKPVSLPVSGVIPGWQEALKMMREGDKWEIVVPYDLAYGTTGQGIIGPNQALIFDITLLEVLDKDIEPKK